MKTILVTGLVLVVTAACSTRSPTVTPPMPPPPEGRSTFRVLSEPAAPAKAHDVEVTIVPVAPGPENQLPPYPADALEAESYVDFEFLFEVVDGQASVRPR